MKKDVQISGVIALFIVICFLGLRFCSKPAHERGEKISASVKGTDTQTKQEKQTIQDSSHDSAMDAQQMKALEKSREEYNQQVKKKIDLLVLTPITFYGKVVDEEGNGIADATINASFANKFMENSPSSNYRSDSNGNFKLSGHGLSVGLTVSKEGYYGLGERSGGTFNYSTAVGQLDTHTNPDKPAIFVLKKKRADEALFSFFRGWRVKEDGTPIFIDLSAGTKRDQQSDRTIKVEAWIHNENITLEKKNFFDQYDWKYVISVPGGGLIPRKGEYDFIAPEQGYQESVTIDMPVSKGDDWVSMLERDYFVKLANGNYARITIQVRTNIQSGVAIISHYNPSGSRNLEYDRSKPIMNH